MGETELKAQKNTYRAIEKMFLQKKQWTQKQIEGVLVDRDNVLAGGRTIKRWLEAKVAVGYLRKEGELYVLNELK